MGEGECEGVGEGEGGRGAGRGPGGARDMELAASAIRARGGRTADELVREAGSAEL